jgi:hypothetical protein
MRIRFAARDALFSPVDVRRRDQPARRKSSFRLFGSIGRVNKRLICALAEVRTADERASSKSHRASAAKGAAALGERLN